MFRYVILFCIAALVNVAAAAAPSINDLRGTWVWEVEGRNLFVLTLQTGPKGVSGTLQRPNRIMLTLADAGLTVSNIQMPPISGTVKYLRETPTGHILSFTNAEGVVQEFLLRPDGADGALFGFSTTDSAAPVARLSRPRSPTALATDWEAGRTYVVRAPPEAANAEITELFMVDQADRQAGRKIDWAVVGPRDAARRLRVRTMLDEGLIRSADDYYHAAFVFQHGDLPADYLLAHVLAMAAQSKGRPDAGWISTATLDRYLRSTGKPQILGTQYVNGANGALTQGEFDTALIPDSVRAALGVPSRAQQEVQMRAMEAGR